MKSPWVSGLILNQHSKGLVVNVLWNMTYIDHKLPVTFAHITEINLCRGLYIGLQFIFNELCYHESFTAFVILLNVIVLAI